MLKSYSINKILWAAPVVGVFVIAANLILYYVAYIYGYWPEDGINYNKMPNKPINHIPVIVSSFLPAIVAGLIFAILVRFTAKPLTIFTIISVILSLLSLAAPLNLQNISIETKITMELMHIVAAVFIITLIPRLSRTSTRKAGNYPTDNTSF
ncbi:MAG: DUF6069 family protein [Bacteroidota bacterium]|nr:DUF6069 family protein [Bacteroidota bacterium]